MFKFITIELPWALTERNLERGKILELMCLCCILKNGEYKDKMSKTNILSEILMRDNFET